MSDLKGLFEWETWKRAFTFKRKNDGLNNLTNLKCPICNATMERYKNEGLNIEEKLFSVNPYFCMECKNKGKDYPIFNVGWRSEEAKVPIYGLALLILGAIVSAIFRIIF